MRSSRSSPATPGPRPGPSSRSSSRWRALGRSSPSGVRAGPRSRPAGRPGTSEARSPSPPRWRGRSRRSADASGSPGCRHPPSNGRPSPVIGGGSGSPTDRSRRRWPRNEAASSPGMGPGRSSRRSASSASGAGSSPICCGVSGSRPSAASPHSTRPTSSPVSARTARDSTGSSGDSTGVPSRYAHVRRDLAVETLLEPPASDVDTAAFLAKGLAEKLCARLAGEALACSLLGIEVEMSTGDRLARRWAYDGAWTPALVAERLRWQLEAWLTGAGPR